MIRRRWATPFHWSEWCCEHIAYRLAHWAFLDVLNHLGRLTILLAVIFYITECDNRRQAQIDQRLAKQYQAWQAITQAHNKPGSGGRIQALQELHREGVSLDGVDVSEAYLVGIELPNANLSGANFQNANLWKAQPPRGRTLVAPTSRWRFLVAPTSRGGPLESRPPGSVSS